MIFPEMGGVHHPLDVMPKNTPTRACCFRLRHRKLKTLDSCPRKTEKDTIYILSRKNATQNLNGFSKKQERITMNHVS